MSRLETGCTFDRPDYMRTCRVLLTPLRSLHEGKFENRKATFQQYAVTEAEIVAKVRFIL